MAKVTKQIGFTIEVDEDAVAPASVNVWIYRLIMGLSFEHTITSITVDGTTVEIENQEQLYDLPLGEDKDLTA